MQLIGLKQREAGGSWAKLTHYNETKLSYGLKFKGSKLESSFILILVNVGENFFPRLKYQIFITRLCKNNHAWQNKTIHNVNMCAVSIGQSESTLIFKTRYEVCSLIHSDNISVASKVH